MLTLGEIIKTYRLKNNISQNELADRCDIPQPLISYLENGKRYTVQYTTLSKLSEGMALSFNRLFDIMMMFTDDVKIQVNKADDRVFKKMLEMAREDDLKYYHERKYGEAVDYFMDKLKVNPDDLKKATDSD